MIAAWPVFVMDVDGDLLANRTLYVELDARGVVHEGWGDVKFDGPAAEDSVGGEVLAFEVRVDRHVVLGASSTDRWDEVDSCDPAAFLDQAGRLWGQEELHCATSPSCSSAPAKHVGEARHSVGVGVR